MTEITEDQKQRFLDHYASGLNRQQAANALGLTGRPFRALCNPRSVHYDAWFADQYEELTAEHEAGVGEKAEADLLRAAEDGNIRAIEKVLMAYHPRYEFLKPKHWQGEINIERLQVLLPGIPTEALEQAIAHLELEAGHPVIDAA